MKNHNEIVHVITDRDGRAIAVYKDEAVAAETAREMYKDGKNGVGRFGVFTFRIE